MLNALETQNPEIGRAALGMGYCDGQYMPLNEMSVSILDFGFIHADATYDVCHVKNGRAFLFDRHLERFYKSASMMRLPVPVSQEQIGSIAANLWHKSGFDDGFLWLCLTRGVPSSGNPRDLQSCRSRFMMYVKPYYGFSSDQTVSVCVAKTVRRSGADTIDPRWKNFAWVDLTKAQWEAQDLEYDTAILSDQRGFIAEGPGFNIGLVKNDCVRAPKDNALYGVSMQAVAAASERIGLSFNYSDLTREDFLAADEIFITSTSGGVIPVHKFELRDLEQHTRTQQLIKEYWAMHQLDEFSQLL